MKRVTFVLIGILAITGIVLLTQNSEKNKSASIVKIDSTKHRVSGIFN